MRAWAMCVGLGVLANSVLGNKKKMDEELKASVDKMAISLLKQTVAAGITPEDITTEVDKLLSSFRTCYGIHFSTHKMLGVMLVKCVKEATRVESEYPEVAENLRIGTIVLMVSLTRHASQLLTDHPNRPLRQHWPVISGPNLVEFLTQEFGKDNSSIQSLDEGQQEAATGTSTALDLGVWSVKEFISDDIADTSTKSMTPSELKLWKAAFTAFLAVRDNLVFAIAKTSKE